jgi:hypothetical protein
MKTMFFESSISLPYGSLISRTITKFVEILETEITVKPLGPFYQATIRHSKAQMHVWGTKDIIDDDDIANNLGLSGGHSTTSTVSLANVMAKQDAMSTQIARFTSILLGLQKHAEATNSKIRQI